MLMGKKATALRCSIMSESISEFLFDIDYEFFIEPIILIVEKLDDKTDLFSSDFKCLVRNYTRYLKEMKKNKVYN